MAKDFKNEYSKHIESETPDLWSRIESGLTDKSSSKVVSLETKRSSKIYTWKKAMPAVAAVLLLLVAAPLVAPRVMEKSSDMAMFDADINTESLKYEMVMDSVIEEDFAVYDVAETVEEAGVPEDGYADNGASGATTSGNGGAETSPQASANTEMKQTKDGVDKEADCVEIIMLHFLVIDKVQDMNLLAIDKEHIGPIYDCYLIEVDGKEKVLGVPYAAETELEVEAWYDMTVTDSTEYGIDYIWAK